MTVPALLAANFVFGAGQLVNVAMTPGARGPG